MADQHWHSIWPRHCMYWHGAETVDTNGRGGLWQGPLALPWLQVAEFMANSQPPSLPTSFPLSTNTSAE